MDPSGRGAHDARPRAVITASRTPRSSGCCAHHHAGPRASRGDGATRAWIVALSGRNRLHGFVEEVRVDGLMAQVRLRIGDQLLTAVITRDAVDELKLRRGDEAWQSSRPPR